MKKKKKIKDCSTCKIKQDNKNPGKCLDNGCIHFASTLGIYAIQCDYSGYIPKN